MSISITNTGLYIDLGDEVHHYPDVSRLGRVSRPFAARKPGRCAISGQRFSVGSSIRMVEGINNTERAQPVFTQIEGGPIGFVSGSKEEAYQLNYSIMTDELAVEMADHIEDGGTVTGYNGYGAKRIFRLRKFHNEKRPFEGNNSAGAGGGRPTYTRATLIRALRGLRYAQRSNIIHKES